MKPAPRPCLLRRPARSGPAFCLVLLALVPVAVFAEAKKKNPTSKVYVADLNGDAQIDTGDNVQDLNKRAVYTAQGTIIETKKAETLQQRDKVFSTMVYSNGTGAYFAQDTKVEVRRFVQEPFTPNRSDMEVEPSISQTQAYVSKGVVGLCTSKLVAGSSMNYQTPHGAVAIRGKKVVIEANDNETKISMLEGDSTVRGGNLDLGGHILHAGEQAIIRPGGAGRPNIVNVQPIPQAEASALDDKVAMACMAKKSVYFEVKERKIESGGEPGSAEAAVASSVKSADNASGTKTGEGDTASGGSTDGTGSGSSGGSGGGNTAVTVFDGPVANANPFTNPGTTNKPAPTTVQEIVAVPVVPTTLPVEFTVSPARITTPAPGGG